MPQDDVLAYAWFNLATAGGDEEARKVRDRLFGCDGGDRRLGLAFAFLDSEGRRGERRVGQRRFGQWVRLGLASRTSSIARLALVVASTGAVGLQ